MVRIARSVSAPAAAANRDALGTSATAMASSLPMSSAVKGPAARDTPNATIASRLRLGSASLVSAPTKNTAARHSGANSAIKVTPMGGRILYGQPIPIQSEHKLLTTRSASDRASCTGRSVPVRRVTECCGRRNFGLG
jgi:hypothetical protein